MVKIPINSGAVRDAQLRDANANRRHVSRKWHAQRFAVLRIEYCFAKLFRHAFWKKTSRCQSCRVQDRLLHKRLSHIRDNQGQASNHDWNTLARHEIGTIVRMDEDPAARDAETSTSASATENAGEPKRARRIVPLRETEEKSRRQDCLCYGKDQPRRSRRRARLRDETKRARPLGFLGDGTGLKEVGEICGVGGVAEIRSDVENILHGAQMGRVGEVH